MSEEANVTVMTAAEDQPDFRPIHGRIVTGMPLSVAAQKRIVQRFETLLGRHVRLSLYVDKTLIAGVRVELNESPTSAQLAALKGGEIACGFFHPDAAPVPGLATKLLLQEKNGVLLPREHPLARVRRLRLRDLADQRTAAGRAPKIFLAALGPMAEHTARLQYAQNFFAALGREIDPVLLEVF